MCLIMSRRYLEAHFEDICNHANAIEARLDDSGLNPQELIRENERNLALCREYGLKYLLIDDEYHISL